MDQFSELVITHTILWYAQARENLSTTEGIVNLESLGISKKNHRAHLLGLYKVFSENLENISTGTVSID